jgi:ABC-type bacteriocin/lantibiotic exporter with double-glycine peptidase domain
VFITIGLLFVGGFLVLDQKMNIGQFVAAEIIILLIINSVEKLIVGMETLYDVLTAVEKIGLVADLEIHENQKKSESDSSETHLTIEAVDMGYRYPDDDKDIIKNIDLKINHGERIIISGINNSGKTTLVRLLSGYLSPTSGVIYVNESVMKRSESGYFKNYTGLVMQDDTLFEGSLLENLTFNNPKVTSEDVNWALDAVGLTLIVKRLPAGLDTIINSDGRHLTRSVIQKIMIARAIVSRPKILFLEEPTISMDPKAARQIIDFLVREENDWTIIVSSIDEYWIKVCNREIDMNNGEIIRDTITVRNA